MKPSFIAFLLALPLLGAADPSVWNQLPLHAVNPVSNPAGVKVGDPILLEVEDVAPIYQVTYPPNTDDLIDQGWDIEKAKSLGKCEFIAVPIKPGKLTLPSLAVLDTAGNLVGKTAPWEVEVKSSIPSTDPKPTEPAPLRPPLRIAFPTWALVALIVIAVAILAAGSFFLWRYWVHNRGKVKPLPQVPKTEDEIALSQLLDYEKRKLWEIGKFKTHYFGISETLKNYLGSRYAFEAPEMTSAEVLRKIPEVSPMGDDLQRNLARLFERLDLVKFTDHTPEKDQAQQILRDAREFVQITRRPKLISEESHAPRR